MRATLRTNSTFVLRAGQRRPWPSPGALHLSRPPPPPGRSPGALGTGGGLAPPPRRLRGCGEMHRPGTPRWGIPARRRSLGIPGPLGAASPASPPAPALLPLSQISSPAPDPRPRRRRQPSQVTKSNFKPGTINEEFCRPWRLVLPGTKINARNRNLITWKKSRNPSA